MVEGSREPVTSSGGGWIVIAGDFTHGKDGSSSDAACMLPLLQSFGLKKLRFTVKPRTSAVENAGVPDEVPIPPNAFDKMGQAQRPTHLPKPKVPGTRKDELSNELLDLLKARGVGFSLDTVEQGSYLLAVLTNSLWYITNQHAVFHDASMHNADVTPIPDCWSAFQGWNAMKRKKLKEGPMAANLLHSHSEALLSVSDKPYMQRPVWKTTKEDIYNLAVCLRSYANYLQKKTRQSADNRARPHPVRHISENIQVEHRPKTHEHIAEAYRLLDAVMKTADFNTPVQFDEELHVSDPFPSSWHRFSFLQHLQLSVPVDMLKYQPGGSKVGIMYLWRVASNRSQDQQLTETSRAVAELQPKLPVFHTRMMKRMFKVKYGSVAKLTGSVMNAIYADLTGDVSSPQNPMMNQRIQVALSGEPGLAIDLRTLNSGRPGDKFDVFFSKLEDIVNEVTATDERRHGVAHLTHWISLKDLIQQAKEKCPEDCPIPSSSLVRLQFAPRNPYTHRALSFTSRFNLQYKIQVRQLRATHPDSHFCAALFKYLRSRILQLATLVYILFIDDKAKVPVGEPGNPISTGVRGRMSIAPTTTTYGALDHDMQRKASITSTVYMEPQIPNKLEESWYRGKVKVAVADSVRQKSSAYRNAAATIKLASLEEEVKPIHIKFSDGGTEHRNVLTKVQLSLIAVFKILGLDMLIAARTAPGQSWLNPVERVMSLLNIALQNCATERAECPGEFEQILHKCGSMADVRKECDKNPDLADAWDNSIQPVIDSISARYGRLTLKDEPVQVVECVTDAEEDRVCEVLREMFPGINPNTVTKADAVKCPQLQAWINNHCRQRQYVFQIRKCSDSACCPSLHPDVQRNNIDWLPDPVLDKSGEHYLPLEEVQAMGTDTTDQERPSLKAMHKKKSQGGQVVDYFMSTSIEEQHKNPGMFTGQNARAMVFCAECDKPRVIYSTHGLSRRQELSLTEVISEGDYTCGAPLLPPDHPLSKNAHVRLTVSCGDPIELSFYRARFARSDVCAHCGGAGGETSEELKKRFFTVLPCCAACVQGGKTHIVSRPFGRQK